MKRLAFVLGLLALPAKGGADIFRDAHLAETITVSNSAIGPTTASFVARNQYNGRGGTDYCFCTVATDAIRFRYDGTNPTASVGHLVAAGGTFEVEGYQNVRNLKMIRVTSDATVFCTYERTTEFK